MPTIEYLSPRLIFALKGTCAVRTDHLGEAAGGAAQLLEFASKVALLLQGTVLVLHQAPHLDLRSVQLLPADSSNVFLGNTSRLEASDPEEFIRRLSYFISDARRTRYLMQLGSIDADVQVA